MTKSRALTPNDDESFRWNSPFSSLRNLPVASPPPKPLEAAATPVKPRNRGRVDVLRQTAHRGGKTVTVATNFVGISQREKAQLAKAMQRACGAGGTVKGGRIEIQGDQREVVVRILAEAGFRPVLAGG